MTAALVLVAWVVIRPEAGSRDIRNSDDSSQPQQASPIAKALEAMSESSSAVSAFVGENQASPAKAPDLGAGDRLDEVDDDWNALPRSKRPFINTVKRNPSYLDPKDLFRSVCLNPRDHRIPRSQRVVFSELLLTLRPMRVAFFEARNNVFALAVGQNDHKMRATRIPAPIVEVKRPDGSAPTQMYSISTESMSAAGIDFATVRDGVVFGLSMRDMPECSPMLDMEKFARIEFGTLLVEWFKANGALTDLEGAALLEPLFRD